MKDFAARKHWQLSHLCHMLSSPKFRVCERKYGQARMARKRKRLRIPGLYLYRKAKKNVRLKYHWTFWHAIVVVVKKTIDNVWHDELQNTIVETCCWGSLYLAKSMYPKILLDRILFSVKYVYLKSSAIYEYHCKSFSPEDLHSCEFYTNYHEIIYC